MIYLELLGKFRASVDAREIIGFPTEKVRSLLCYLALESEHAHQRETLAGIFWPEQESAAARSNVRKSLHRLRSLLDESDPGLSAEHFIVTRDSVQIIPSAVWIDANEVTRQIAAVFSHAHRQLHACPSCLAALAAAVERYQGQLLPDAAVSDAPAFEEWLLLRRERLDHQVVAALQDLVAAHAARNDHERAILFGRRLVELDPYNEKGYRLLMHALVQHGQTNEALTIYARLENLLRTDLGVRPESKTVALAHQMRIIRQEGATKPRGSPLNGVPAQFTPFWGRQAELRLINDLVLDPTSRLLSIVGPGGIGKTRLCIEAAREISATSEFHDGIYFVPLSSAVTRTDLIAALATEIGVPLRKQHEILPQVLDFLRNKRALLVLDDFEHLVAHGQVLTDILAAAPRVELLVSTRQPLNLRAERHVRVAGLDYPDTELSSDAGDTALAGFSSVQLFLQTARAAMPEFALTPDNQDDIRRICNLLQGIPLAIEIAGRWIRLADCATIAGEIAQSLDLLVSPLIDLPDRHRSMTAVFAHSWQMLTPAEQALLARLSVFRGPFSLSTALAVLDCTIKDIATLLDKSLLQRTAGGRYVLHELLRQFAAARLDGMDALPDIYTATRQRHSTFYLQKVAEQEVRLAGPNPKRSATLIHERIGNIRHAWQWAVEQNQLDAINQSLDGYARYHEYAGLIGDGLALVDETLAELRKRNQAAPGPHVPYLLVQSFLLIWKAHFSDRLGHSGDAIATAEEALALAVRSEDCYGIARAESILGALLPNQGRFEEALAHQHNALRYAEETDDLRLRARATCRLGIIQWRYGQYQAARATLPAALQLSESLQDKAAMARALSSLGGVHWEQDDLEQALIFVEQAARIYDEIGDRIGRANMAGNLALIYSRLGRFDAALAANQFDLDVATELGDRHGIATTLGNRGSIYEAQHSFELALTCYQQAQEIERELGNIWDAARQAAAIAHLQHLVGNDDAALDGFESALPVLNAHGALYYVVQPLLDSAEIHHSRSADATAIELNRSAYGIARELGLQALAERSLALATRLGDSLAGTGERSLRLPAN